MILDPDFLDHWKTRLLIELMDDELASNYILRLWFHCQLRRTTTFEGMTGQVLKVVCRYNGDGDKLRETMLRVGFIDVDGDTVFVPKWAEANDKMAANWENGKKGGRPKKPAKTPEFLPPKNPPETKPKPNDNPRITGREVGREEEKEGRKECAQAEPLEKVAAEMATDFQFNIPGRSRPMLDELRENFLAKLQWLKANGRDETDLIWKKIRDPARDKTQVTTINQMFKFWQYCGLEGGLHDASGTGKRPTNGANARRSVPGGDSFGDASRYDGSRVKVFRHDGKHGNEQSTVSPSQPASPSD